METILYKVTSCIQENKLLTPSAKIIVGLSGGADSVSLIHVLQAIGYECIAAHCNFHLRGHESDRDELFVQQLATHLGLVYQKIDFDTKNYAREQKISIEMAARELRYEWFEKLRLEFDAQAIAVAHHADDNVETLLMNLTRGTGIKGMTGIPVRNGFVVRPLLHATRIEILEYLEINNLTFVSDSTNFENQYVRNRFRNEIIPALEEINPAFRQTISDTISRFDEIEAIYNEHIALEISNLCKVENGITYIDTTILKSKKYAKTILYELLSPYNFHIDTIFNVLKALYALSGTVFYSTSHTLLYDRNRLLLTARRSNDSNTYAIHTKDAEIKRPIHLKISRRKNDGKILKSACYATFDASKLEFPLVLRHWQKGDTFVPFGMNTHKKVSDFFIDAKVNRFEKDNIWLLISGNNIVWVVGYRTDHRYSVTNNSTEIIEIQLIT